MDEIYTSILRSTLAMGWTQWAAFVFSLVYVILAAKESIWCWLFGLIGVVLAFVVYVEYKLYSEALLQIYYAVVSVYGLWAWRNKQGGEDSEVNSAIQNDDEALQISTWTSSQHFKGAGLGIGMGIIWGFFWSHFGAAMPYIDAMIATFSVIATYMVAQKILENWLYWIIIDAICIVVYIHRGIYLFAILFFIYCIVAVFGYFNWQKELSD